MNAEGGEEEGADDDDQAKEDNPETQPECLSSSSTPNSSSTKCHHFRLLCYQSKLLSYHMSQRTMSKRTLATLSMALPSALCFMYLDKQAHQKCGVAAKAGHGHNQWRFSYIYHSDLLLENAMAFVYCT
jgi:hypothetical protein